MFSIGISNRHFASLLILLFAVAGSAAAQSSALDITVVYPKDTQTVAVKDSEFIFGHITPASRDARLSINGVSTPVHEEGGFLAFLPIRPGDFKFNLICSLQVNERWEIATDSIRIKIPPPIRTVPTDSFKIVGDYQPPLGDIELGTDARLLVRFQATPECTGWFSIKGVADSVPMIETTDSENPFWGESTFGSKQTVDTASVRGIYLATMRIPKTARCDTTRIVYHLIRNDSTITKESVYRVSVNTVRFPVVVRFKDSVQTIRHAPQKGYHTIFQSRGVTALAVGAEGPWYQLRLSETETAWAQKESVELGRKGEFLAASFPTTVRTIADSAKLLFQIPLSRRHPFQIEETGRRSLTIRLFGVTSNTDWIRYVANDSLIDYAYWRQPEADVFEVQINLTKDIWGYDSYYDGNTFCFALIRPPKSVGSVWGKRIVIDPGHAPDLGAVGPTGFTEAEANLAISLKLAELLRENGAEVTLTRTDNTGLPLDRRPVVAKLASADLYVSVHNNSVPDGVNPFLNNGTSTYYYHLHSLALARSVQRELLKATELRDHGLYYANFHVTRPTQYPAILAECAFMILPEQEALLRKSYFQLKLAEAIADGIKSFLKAYEHGN